MVFVGICLFVGIFFYSQKNREKEQQNPSEKVNIVVTFYPLQYFAQQVGGELVNVTTLTPSGGEPHDYSPTPQDIIKIKTSDIFILNGAGLEPWTTKLLPQLTTEKIKTLTMSEQVELLSNTNHESESEEEHEKEMGQFDPHIWLDPVRAQQQVTALKNLLISIDPSHTSTYEQNAKNSIQKLENLQKEFSTGLSLCKKREIISSHNAFQYLAQRFQFHVESIAGFSPEEDPSPKHLAELSKLVTSKNIGYIFTETLASPKFVDTLSHEAKVKTLVLNPLEGLTQEDLRQEKDYLSIMRENLNNLKTAMECE